MPRFFFDFCQAGDFTADTAGIELADVEESFLEAVKGAQEMFSELLKLRRDPRHCRFEVRSEGGDVLFHLPFQEVLDCCTESRRISRPSLSEESRAIRDYARRMTGEMRQEIQNSHRVLNQSRALLAEADGMMEAILAAPRED